MRSRDRESPAQPQRRFNASLRRQDWQKKTAARSPLPRRRSRARLLYQRPTSSSSVGARSTYRPRRLRARPRRSAISSAPGTPAPAETSRRAALRVCRPIAMVSSKPAVVTHTNLCARPALQHGVRAHRRSMPHKRPELILSRPAAQLPQPVQHRQQTDRPALKTASARAIARLPGKRSR